MAWKLSNLPAEIVDLILRFNVGCAPVNLWISGDRSMMSRIAEGLSCLVLENTQELAICRLPLFLSNLRVLRELTVSRDGFLLLCYARAWETVQKLPSTLRKLEFRFRSSGRLVLPHSIAKHSSGDRSKDISSSVTNNWTLKSAFPYLERLQVMGLNEPDSQALLQSLPDSLTSFDCSVYSNEQIVAFTSALPRQLLHLKLHKVKSLECLKFLPPGLLSLNLLPCRIRYDNRSSRNIAYYQDVFSKLPRTLTELQARFDFQDQSILLDMPPLLTQLEWHTTQAMDFDLGKHFPSLTDLKTSYCTSSTIYRLPRKNFRKLDIRVIEHLPGGDYPSDFWPPSLQELNIAYLPDAALPTSLTNLHIVSHFGWSGRQLERLPSSLTHLRYHLKSSRPDIAYLSNLTRLELDSNKDDDEDDRNRSNALPTIVDITASNIPPSITDLTLNNMGISASKLSELPPSLTSLSLQDIIEDKDFDPTSELHISSMRRNFTNGLANGIQENFDWTLLSKSSTALLLPRSLKRLVVSNGTHLVRIMDWKHLPPTINVLHVKPTFGVPEDAIFDMPLRNLTSLAIHLSAPRDEHLRCIPKMIPHLELSVDDPSHLTPLAAALLPANMTSGIEGPLQSAIDYLYSTRRSALANADPSHFLNYMAGDEELLETLVKTMSQDKEKF